MTKTEMNARYTAAMNDLNAQKSKQSGQAYAAGASILVFRDSAFFHKAAFAAKFLLLVLGIFAAFYMTQQI